MKPAPSIVLIGSLPLSTRVLRSLVERGCHVVGVVTEPVRREYVDLFSDPATIDYVHREGLKRLTLDEVEAMPPNSVDLGFSVRAPYILSGRLLSVFRRGVVNFHGGPLPELRGVNCANTSILSSLGYSGGTLHLMEESIDTGPVLAKSTFRIESGDTAYDVFLKTQAALWEAYSGSVASILDGTVEPLSQEEMIAGGLTSVYYNRQALKPLRTRELDTATAGDLVERARGLDFPGHEPLRLRLGDHTLFATTRPKYAGAWARRAEWEGRQKAAFGKALLGGLEPLDTPIERLPGLSRRLGIDLRVKRDDVLGAGGGSKERKAREIFRAAQAAGATAVITTGGVGSNHCRVVAQWAARLRWPCHLVVHGDPEVASASANLRLMSLVGATVELVTPDAIAAQLEAARSRLEGGGHSPVVIPGGGHSPDGVAAYVAAALEAEQQCADARWLPDVVIHASGTGGTQAGLAIGYAAAQRPVYVHGISVARRRERGAFAVSSAAREWCLANGRDPEDIEVLFHDDWVGAGYGHSDQNLEDAIRVAAQEDGLLTDRTYTGKAMQALLSMAEDGRIAPGARVLFWHTGGLVNCVSDQLAGGWGA